MFFFCSTLKYFIQIFQSDYKFLFANKKLYSATEKRKCYFSIFVIFLNNYLDRSKIFPNQKNNVNNNMLLFKILFLVYIKFLRERN